MWFDRILVRTYVLQKLLSRELLDISASCAVVDKLESALNQVLFESCVVDLIIAKLHYVLTQQKIGFLCRQHRRPSKALLHRLEIDKARVLFSLWVKVLESEFTQNVLGSHLSLMFVNERKTLLIDLFCENLLFGYEFVTRQESLNCFNSNRDELSP